MGCGTDVVKRLLKLGFVIWVLRWAVQELVAYAGRHWQSPGRPPRESPRPPGWMPPPDDVL